MSGARIRLILDTSAVLAYMRGSIDVGETIAEVVDEGDAFGASVLSLAEAARRAQPEQRDRITLLAAHRRFHPLSAHGEQWARLATWAVMFDDVQLAATVIEAVDHHGYLITDEPDRYTRVPGGENLPVISF